MQLLIMLLPYLYYCKIKFFIKFYLFLDKSLLDFINELTPIIDQNNLSEIHNDKRDDDMLTLYGMYIHLTVTILSVILLTH